MADTKRQYKRVKARIITAVAVAMSVYHILYISQIFTRLGLHIVSIPHRSITLAFLIVLALLILPGSKGERRDRVPWYDVVLMILGTAGPLYNVFFWLGNIYRYSHYEKFTVVEYAVFFITLLITLEITRRAIGLAMPLFALIMVVYMFFADRLPGFLFTGSASLDQATNLLVFSTQGIYGVAMDVASTVIIMFMIFGAFLFITPAGQFFIDVAMALVGHVRGGPAKVAVISSAFFGTMSGAAMANVAVTGSFTIPMMKKIGYEPAFAGAVEAVASTGGVIMPPVMGAVAFLMAEWLGITYWSVCVACAIPAILYFIAVFVMVDAEAARLGLRGVPRAECPPLKKALREGWTAVLPVAALIVCLGIFRYSAQFSVLYALGVLILISMLRKETRLGVDKFIAGLRNGAVDMLPAGTACACAGIVIGSLAVTQLGIKLSDAVVTVSGGNLMLLLLAAAASAYVLGMGMSSIPVYVMVVVFVAPALLKLGVLPLPAHLFVFYWAMTCHFTPPVAGAVFVACGIAGSSPWKTGVNAMKLGIIAYIVPFVFVYNPVLLMLGSPLEIALAFVTATIGTTLLGWGIIGYGIGRARANWVQRILFMAGGILLIVPGWFTDILGLIIGGLAVLWWIKGWSLVRLRGKSSLVIPKDLTPDESDFLHRT